MATPLEQIIVTRYSPQTLRAITNPDDPQAQSPDAVRLQAAVDDVEGDFILMVGASFDATKKEHVSTAVAGVIAKLQFRHGDPRQGRSAHEAYEERLARLERIESSARFSAITDSRLTPTKETELEDSPVRPWSDPRNFRDWNPKPPS